MLKNRSGQFVYFSMLSALSGTPLAGLSGMISGRKSLDGLSGMIVLSGNVIELGGGSYRANLFDFDTNGDQAGYLFTGASAAVPVQYQFDMIDGNGSGNIWLASGATVTVPKASISGVIANSGLFASVPIASISGTIVNSGLFVTVPIASISGAIANSGLFVTATATLASGSLSGQLVQANVVQSLGVAITNYDFILASGGSTDVTVPALFTNGDTLPDDDRFLYCELQTVGGTGPGQNILLTTAAAGARQYNVLAGTMPVTTDETTQCIVVGTWRAQSGLFASVPIASISGTIVNSGLFASVPIASISGVIANSGLFVTVPKATISGVIANSGLFVVATATVDPATISGAFVTVPIATISGAVANSGLFVTAAATIASGTLFLASGSVILPSGGNVSLFSGQSVLVYSGQLSGQTISASGSVYLASGSLFPNTFASGLLTAYLPDSILQRDFTGSSGFLASGMSGRCLVNAERKLINRWDLTTSGFLTVYQEDDLTISYRQTIGATSGAAPVTSLDTV